MTMIDIYILVLNGIIFFSWKSEDETILFFFGSSFIWKKQIWTFIFFFSNLKRELIWISFWIQSYGAENTSSRPIWEVKLHTAVLVLRWEITWEPSVPYPFFFIYIYIYIYLFDLFYLKQIVLFLLIFFFSFFTYTIFLF